jgi:sortase (surface protein transpeptidase)
VIAGRVAAAIAAAAALSAPAVIMWPRGADVAVTIVGSVPAQTALAAPQLPTASTSEAINAMVEGPIDHTPTTSTPPTTTPASTVATHPASVAQLTPASVAAPARVEIEGTKVVGDVVPTAIDAATGELAIPDDAAIVGWYQYGPSPGEPGSAVLAGHLDFHHKPGAFYHLDGISIGAIVTIRYTDGASRRFQVMDSTLVPKQSLPLSDVFVRSGPPTLRLITCGGSFDRTTRHYRSNVVVTAVPLD